MRLPARWLVRRHPRAFLCACVGCALACLTCLALLLARRPSPPDAQLRTDAQLVLQHYDARQLLFRRRARRLVFLHIHKAAGSTVCQLAIDAGELVNRDNNCNLAGTAKRDLAAGTKAEQCGALRHSPYTFLANERGLPDAPWWDGEALYVTMLREPRERTVSQYLHLKRYGEAYLRGKHAKWPAELRHMRVEPGEGVPSLAEMLRGRDGRIAAGFRRHFQTRALAGTSMHVVPGGNASVSAEHLAAAKQHLEAFDLVMTVATLSQDVVALASIAGWARANATAARRGSREETASYLTSLDAETRGLLDAQAGHDDELYAHATALNARLHAAGSGAARTRPASCTASRGAGTPEEGPSLPVKCSREADALVAACAVVSPGAMSPSHLMSWLQALNSSGVTRVYLHVDGETAEGATQSLEPLIRDGFLLPLHAVHPPPRYGIHEHVAGPAGGTPWAGYSEVLGRCITHALLDGACWLAHLAPGHMPRGRFTVAGAGRGDALSSFAGHMCLRFWDDGGRQPGGHQAHTPPTFAPWLLNVPAAYDALVAHGSHAVVPSPASLTDRSKCTKCRGMDPRLGLQDRHTPEVDPCVPYYRSSHAKRRESPAASAPSSGSRLNSESGAMASAPSSRDHVVWFCQACKRALELHSVPEDLPAAEPAELFSPPSGVPGDLRQETRSALRQLEDSFVMLHPDGGHGSTGQGHGSSQEPGEAPPSSPSAAQYQALSKVWALASDETAVDHPMCRDCADVLRREIEAQAAEAEDAVAAYKALLDDLRQETRQLEAGDAPHAPSEQDVRRLEAAIAAEEAALAADLAALHAAEADLSALAADADAMRQAEVAHDAALAAHELAAAKHTDEVASLRMRTAVASVHLDLLRRTHVFNDAFHIWHDGAFGTISGFRLGRTASVPVDWPEINAAFGQACLLLHTLAHVARFTFSGFTLLPLGSTSRVRDNMRGGTYDLFGPVGGLNLLSAQRFDKAQAGLLACLREFGAFATARDLAGGAAQPFELPYDIEGDRVGGRSVRFSLNSDDKWTAALKLMLTDLKMVLAWTSAAFLTAEGGRA